MATKQYRGDAPAVSKKVVVPRPTNYQAGAIAIKINNKKVEVDSWDASSIVEAWNNSIFPEMQSILASVGGEEASSYGFSPNSVVLTAKVPGEDFFVSVEIGGSGVTNEVQILTFSPVPTGGTYTLSFNGQTTSAITFDPASQSANIAAITAALEALSNIAPGDVTVTSTAIGVYLVTFAGAYLNIDVPLITTDYTSLTGGDIVMSVATTQTNVAPVNEVQTLSLPNTPTGGTFTLTYAGQTTGAIAYNANAATVEAALIALSNLATGDVVCSGGALPGTPVVITFGGTLVATDVALITGNGASLTGGSSNVDNITTVTQGAASGTPFHRDFSGVSGSGGSTEVWFVTIDTAGVRHESTHFLKNSSAATIKAALVGMTVAVVTDPARGTLEDYIIQSSDFTVSGTFNSPPAIFTDSFGNVFSVGQIISGYFSGSDTFNTPGVVLIMDDAGGGPSSTSSGGSFSTAEKQGYQVLDYTKSGSYTLTVYDSAGSPHTTDPILYTDTDVLVIQDAINQALGDTYVYVVGEFTSGGTHISQFYVYYGVAPYVGINFTQLSSNEGSVQILETTPGSAGTSEIQTITPVGIISGLRGGTFTLTFAGQTTSAIAYNATSLDIQLALEALSNIAVADVAVTGSVQLGMTFVWKASLGDVAQLTIVTSSLTNAKLVITDYITGGLEVYFEEVVRNQGPECFDDPKNYDAEGLPSDDDTILFEFGQANCRWGIKQRDTFTVLSTTADTMQLTSKRPLLQDGQKVRVTSTTTAPAGLSSGTAYYVINMDGRGRFQLSATSGGAAINITSAGSGTHTIGLALALLKKTAKYRFEIGLPRNNSNGFEEYRPKYLEVYPTSFILGEGSGSDSSLVRLDTGNQATAGTIYGTGSSSEEEAAAASLLMNHSTSDLICYGGDVGLAAFLDETSVLQDITLFDTSLRSIGGTTCRKITADKGSTLTGKFTPSGLVQLGL